MSNIGYLSNAMYSTVPFDVTVGANVPDSLIAEVNIFNPEPLSQDAMNTAYIFYPPANFSLVSSTSALTLLLAQAISSS